MLTNIKLNKRMFFIGAFWLNSWKCLCAGIKHEDSRNLSNCMR
jgi:hypothetical protein